MPTPDQRNISFTEQLYTLSRINPTRDSITPPYPPFYSIGGDRRFYDHNLRLTDGIALLLSVPDKSDEIADSVVVTYELAQKSISFFYSKSRPYTPAEKTYIERLIDIVRDTPPREKCTVSILCCVIPECQDKIMSRLYKIRAEIQILKAPESSEGMRVYPTTAFEDYIRGRLKGMIPAGMPTDQFLDYYLTSLGEIRSLDNVFQIIQSMHAVYLITTAPDIETVLPYEGLRIRLKKFGEYYSAAGIVSWNTSENPVFLRVKYGLTFTEVPPPSPSPEPLTDSLANLLSYFAATHYLSPFAAPNLACPQPAYITTFIHPEVTLATFMISRRLASAKLRNAPVSGTIEIGMTKSLCWLCKAYLHKLQGENLFTKVMEVDPVGREMREVRAFHVVVSRYESKIKAEWRMPEDADGEVREHVEDLVSREVINVIEAIQYKLKCLDVGTQPLPVERQVFGVDDI